MNFGHSSRLNEVKLRIMERKTGTTVNTKNSMKNGAIIK